MSRAVKYITITFLLAFGALTVFLTSSVLLDLFGIRQKEGNFVSFIVWLNLFSGFLYLASAFGFWKAKVWTTKLLIVNTVLLLSGIVGLYFHINAGGLYKTETVQGMIFRAVATALASFSSYYLIIKNSEHYE